MAENLQQNVTSKVLENVDENGVESVQEKLKDVEKPQVCLHIRLVLYINAADDFFINIQLNLYEYLKCKL